MNKNVLTHTGGGGSRSAGKSAANGSPQASVWLALSAFTMAEILLSLTIIGVVAAITLPSLTGNINERTWDTQRKAIYARMSQAISLMPALNGYGTLDDTADSAAETFVTAGLSKVLKINNICDNEHLADCGVVTSLTNVAGSQTSMPTTLYELSSWFRSAAYCDSSYSTSDTKAAAFETQNGESVIVFYNQSCVTQSLGGTTQYGSVFTFPESNMCVNFIYDLNGNKGPNTVGKDIGIMTVFNAIDPTVVAPIPTGNIGSTAWADAAKFCTGNDSESRLPNIDELSSLLINKNLVNLTGNVDFWASTIGDTQKAWCAHASGGRTGTDFKANEHSVRCIRR